LRLLNPQCDRKKGPKRICLLRKKPRAGREGGKEKASLVMIAGERIFQTGVENIVEGGDAAESPFVQKSVGRKGETNAEKREEVTSSSI